jgi:hypothetical protein
MEDVTAMTHTISSNQDSEQLFVQQICQSKHENSVHDS